MFAGQTTIVDVATAATTKPGFDGCSAPNPKVSYGWVVNFGKHRDTMTHSQW